MFLCDRTSGRVLATRILRAESPWMRLIGWLHRASIGPEEGLWFDGCSAVHTLGMRSAIDVIFLDRCNRVIATQAHAHPGRFSVSCRGAAAVLEMGPSFLRTSELLVSGQLIGHVLELEARAAQASAALADR